MKVTIAGSHRLPRGYASRLLILFLAGLPEDTTILLRCGYTTGYGPFEREVAQLAKALGFDVTPCMPEPGHGREGTFARDIEMVGKSSLVLTFVLPEEAGTGGTGTEHVVEKALDQRVPVYTYTVDESGRVARWGENDPDNEWGDKVPAP